MANPRQISLFEVSPGSLPEDPLSRADAKAIALARFQAELVKRAAARAEARDPILVFQRYCGIPDEEGWGPPPPATAEASS